MATIKALDNYLDSMAAKAAANPSKVAIYQAKIDAKLATLAAKGKTVTNDGQTITSYSLSSGSESGGSSTTTSGRDYTLTLGPDALTGTSSADNFIGSLGTLGTLDEINGGAGSDTLTVAFSPDLQTAGASTAASPYITNVETINITARGNDTATFNFRDVSGETSINVSGRQDINLTNLDLTAVSLNSYTGVISLDLATATASTAAYGLTLNVSSSTAADVVFADDSGSTALADTLTINALGAVTLNTGSTFSGVEQIVLKGDGAVSVNLVSADGGIALTGVADLTADTTAAGIINGAGMTGALTIRNNIASNFNLIGGAGNDTFVMTASLDTNDTIVGGAGTDTLVAILNGYVRPPISGVETLNLVASGASTFDIDNNAQVSTLNVFASANLTATRAGSALNTVTVYSAAGGNLSVQYGTAAAASDVTLNLSNAAVASAFMSSQTAAATATAMTLGAVSMSGNSGSVSLANVSTANWTLDSFSASEFTAVTLNANSGNITVTNNVVVADADTLTLRAGTGKTMLVGNVLSANGADSVAFNADGASALVDLSAANFGTANTLTITTNAAMSGNTGFSAVEMNFQSAAAATGALNLDTLTINALGGDVLIGCADFLSGATSVNLDINANMGSTAVAVTLGHLNITDIASGATGSEQTVTLTLSGTGAFTLNSASVVSSNLTFQVDSRSLASGSTLTIDLSGIDDTGSVVSAVFGAHSGSFVGGDGADSIEAGLGAMTINGGAGADTITLNNTAAHRVELSTANTTTTDTIVGAGSGDTILFINSVTASAAMSGDTGFATGTATTTAQIYNSSLASSIAANTDGSAAHQIAIYTSNGDTIIEVLKNSTVLTAGGATGITAGDVQQIVLRNKDFTAVTAAFQLHTTASGLQVTLL